MKPTKISTLALYVLAAAIVGFALPNLWKALVDRAFPVPWSATTGLVVVALAIAIWAYEVKRRIQGDQGTKRLSAVVAVRTSALALAASRTGAIVGGVYFGVGLHYLQAVYLSKSVAVGLANERIAAAFAAVVASGLLVLAALWLERICRIMPKDEETAADGAPS
jgi:hypothetical protein